MTTVNSWDSFDVDAKTLILDAFGVLDMPLYEIKMSKLISRISVKQDITEYFVQIYLKMTEWSVIFQIFAVVV